MDICATSPSQLGIPATRRICPILEQAAQDEEILVQEHAQWAIKKIKEIASGIRFKRSPSMNKLLIATNNKGKVLEFQELLKNSGIEFVTPAQINLQLDVEEDGSTYQENAGKKATAFAQASGLISLADDSGLEVEVLGGAPGLYSARYSPEPGAKDKDRRDLLLSNLNDKPRPWKAHFHATIAIANPSGEVEIVKEIALARSSLKNAAQAALVTIPFSY